MELDTFFQHFLGLSTFLFQISNLQTGSIFLLKTTVISLPKFGTEKFLETL